MVSNGPYAVEGWREFLEDDDEVWQDAFETTDGGAVDVDAYDEFENMAEIVNFVAGTGSYEERNSFEMTEEDKDRRKRQTHNDQWKVPERVQNIMDALAEGADYSEIDVVPYADTSWRVHEQDARKSEADTKYSAHFIAYDGENTDDQGGAAFYMAFSWYDEEPDTFNLEEKFEFGDVDDMLEGEEE